MSYTPDFAPDARSQWQAMTPHDQELLLDELDRLCAQPPSDDDHVSTLVYETAGLRHFLFLHVSVSQQRRRVTMVGAGHAVRPIVPP